jgi:hypothetical protein
MTNTKERSLQCVKRYPNLEGKYKIECEATMTPEKCKDWIGCREGGNIFY